MAALVIDASTTIGWAMADEKDAYSINVFEHVREEGALVPNLWGLEIANVLLLCERRGRSDSEETAGILADLGKLPIEVDPETYDRAATDAINLAREVKLSVYDASYLELARRRSLALATCDEKLRNAAKVAGVRVFG